MAGVKLNFVNEMVLVVLLLVATVDFTVAQIGVCYGQLGSALPPPSEVVSLYKENNIGRMRIYAPDHPTLDALRDSNIELMLGVPNDQLENLASNQQNADSWIQDNVKNYPNVNFRYIAVGNEVSPLKTEPQGSAQYVPFLLPALQNVHNAITAAGLGNQIKVSTSIETGVLGISYPPSAGEFRSDVRSFLDPIIDALAKNGAPLLVNIYPYFAYIYDKEHINLDYALFKSPGIDTPDGRYPNLFSAILDGMYAALEKAGGSSLEIVVSETGWPSDGGDTTSVDNASTYNMNLVQRVKEGSPKKPGRNIETYIFAMFNEDQKSPEYEKYWGLFLPNKQPKYPISFN